MQFFLTSTHCDPHVCPRLNLKAPKMTEKAAFEVSMMTPIGAVFYRTPFFLFLQALRLKQMSAVKTAIHTKPVRIKTHFSSSVLDPVLGEKHYPVYVLPALLTSTCVGCKRILYTIHLLFSVHLQDALKAFLYYLFEQNF